MTKNAIERCPVSTLLKEKMADWHCDEFARADPEKQWAYGCGVAEGGCCTTSDWIRVTHQRMMDQITFEMRDSDDWEEKNALKMHFSQLKRLGSHIFALPQFYCLVQFQEQIA